MQSEWVLAQRFKTEWDGHSAFFMGAFDPELVGIIFCGRDGPSSVKISAFYVIPERRRRHVGLQLLDDAMARARRWTGLSRFWLDVPITNLPARELYLSRGFRVVGPANYTARRGWSWTCVELELAGDRRSAAANGPPPRFNPLLDLQPPPRRPALVPVLLTTSRTYRVGRARRLGYLGNVLGRRGDLV
jgi:GNAT superfamily N-acetyltransferase